MTKSQLEVRQMQDYDKVGYNKHNDVKFQQSVDRQGSHTEPQTRGCRPSSTNPD